MKRKSTLVLGLIVLTAVTAWGDSRIVYVPSPNGTDDTSNIQAALDKCVAYGKKCTVQLAAGTYQTRQLVAYNFQGTFKGMGRNTTTIQAIYPLPVNLPDFFDGLCKPNTTTCLYPELIIFVNGNIEVSDLSMMELAPPGEATTGWSIGGTEFTDLIATLSFLGNLPTFATVDRINFQGLTDSSTTSTGFNLLNGVGFAGELPRSSKPFDYYVLSGSLTVRNSSFNTMDDGVGAGQLTSSHFIIGGSPSTGNTFENDYGGMDLESAEKSDFEISYNMSSGSNAAMWVVPYHPGLPHALQPSQPSQYSIHDNKFVGTGFFCPQPCGDGLFFIDGPGKPWIRAAVSNNTIQLQSPLMEGIGAYNTVGTGIWNNSITGSDGYDGIGLWNSSYDSVIGNNVSGFTVDPTGLAQIFLDPLTTYDLTVCSNSTDTVLNQGTNNVVIGCTASGAPGKSVEPATSRPRVSLPKGKPWLRY